MDQELYDGAIRVRDGFLEASAPDGRVLVHWSPPGKRIIGLLPVPGGQDAIVLTEGSASLPRGVPTLFRWRPDRGLVWTAEMMTEGDGTYVAAEWSGEEIGANTWDGWRVAIDPSTGRIKRTEFVK